MRALVVGLLLFSCVMPAGAQTSPASTSDEPVKRLLALALDNIQRGRCENWQPCAPATAQEKTNPPLTIAEARSIIDRAVLSAAGEHCGLDWLRQNFEPMMSYWRNTQKKDERQMALVSLLHGIMQGLAQGEFRAKGACNDQQRQTFQQRLAFRP